MFEISALTSASIPNSVPAEPRPEPRSTRPPPPEPHPDRVDLSEAARDYDADALETDERVAELRRQIADGTYLTTEKLEQVVERLYAELFEGAAAN